MTAEHKVKVQRADDYGLATDGRVKWVARCICGWAQGTGTRDTANELKYRHLHPHPSEG